MYLTVIRDWVSRYTKPLDEAEKLKRAWESVKKKCPDDLDLIFKDLDLHARINYTTFHREDSIEQLCIMEGRRQMVLYMRAFLELEPAQFRQWVEETKAKQQKAEGGDYARSTNR